MDSLFRRNKSRRGRDAFIWIKILSQVVFLAAYSNSANAYFSDTSWLGTFIWHDITVPSKIFEANNVQTHIQNEFIHTDSSKHVKQARLLIKCRIFITYKHHQHYLKEADEPHNRWTVHAALHNTKIRGKDEAFFQRKSSLIFPSIVAVRDIEQENVKCTTQDAAITVCQRNIFFSFPAYIPDALTSEEEDIEMTAILSLYRSSHDLDEIIFGNKEIQDQKEVSIVLTPNSEAKRPDYQRTIELFGRYKDALSTDKDKVETAQCELLENDLDGFSTDIICQDLPSWMTIRFDSISETKQIDERDTTWEHILTRILPSFITLLLVELISNRFCKFQEFENEGSGILFVLLLSRQTISTRRAIRWYKCLKRWVRAKISDMIDPQTRSEDQNRKFESAPSVPSAEDCRNNSALGYVSPPRIKRKDWSEVEELFGAYLHNQKLSPQTPVRVINIPGQYYVQNNILFQAERTSRKRKTASLYPEKSLLKYKDRKLSKSGNQHENCRSIKGDSEPKESSVFTQHQNSTICNKHDQRFQETFIEEFSAKPEQQPKARKRVRFSIPESNKTNVSLQTFVPSLKISSEPEQTLDLTKLPMVLVEKKSPVKSSPVASPSLRRKTRSAILCINSNDTSKTMANVNHELTNLGKGKPSMRTPLKSLDRNVGQQLSTTPRKRDRQGAKFSIQSDLISPTKSKLRRAL